MRAFTLIVAAVLSACGAAAAEPVSLVAEDGAVVHADRYGTGAHWVVLVHGARFDKASWGSQARALAEAGMTALAIDLRGYGRSGPRAGSDLLHPGYPVDVLAAIRFARAEGAEAVSLVGGSLGGWAAGQAAVDARPGEIDRLVLLAHASLDEPERMQGRKLFVVARGDVRGENVPRLPDIQEQYARAPEPKELMVLESSAHAQHLFATGEGERLMQEILRFLSAP